MQYIMSQEEMEAVERDRKTLGCLPSADDLQKFCTMVADTTPVQEGWAKGQVWGCILTVKREHYCDACPAEKVCPYHDKHWSK